MKNWSFSAFFGPPVQKMSVQGSEKDMSDVKLSGESESAIGNDPRARFQVENPVPSPNLVVQNVQILPSLTAIHSHTQVQTLTFYG